MCAQNLQPGDSSTKRSTRMWRVASRQLRRAQTNLAQVGGLPGLCRHCFQEWPKEKKTLGPDLLSTSFFSFPSGSVKGFKNSWTGSWMKRWPTKSHRTVYPCLPSDVVHIGPPHRKIRNDSSTVTRLPGASPSLCLRCSARVSSGHRASSLAFKTSSVNWVCRLTARPSRLSGSLWQSLCCSCQSISAFLCRPRWSFKHLSLMETG